MTNNPFRIPTEGFSPEVAAAVTLLAAELAAKDAASAAQSLAEAVEKLRNVA